MVLRLMLIDSLVFKMATGQIRFNQRSVMPLWSGLLRISILLCVGLLLGACQTNRARSPLDVKSTAWLTDPAFFETRSNQFAGASFWRLSGKVAVTTRDGREQANMVWEYQEPTNRLRFYGPLGAGAIKVEFDPFGVVLTDNEGVQHSGKSAEALLTKIIGWPIPIDALTYWLFALPMPENPFRYQTQDNQLTTLEQLGWTIEYSRFREFESGFPALAKKIVATKPVRFKQLRKQDKSKQQADEWVKEVKVVLVAKRWAFNAQ